ncbi:MAG: tetratricopeptide repeat protein [Elusimicrobiales bacterium]|nr:tetratricopeptide repeat protein [Elusimicrobiales bacterium]
MEFFAPDRFKGKIAGLLPYALLLAAVAAVFYPCLRADFVNWDDYALAADNPLVHNVSWRSAAAIFSSYSLGHYQPLTMLSFMAEYAAFGLTPFSAHLINILLHFLNSALVFALAGWFLKDTRKALLAALLFAVHPLHAESAAWVSERKDLLYSAFYLAALLVYVRYLRDRSLRWYFAALGLFALSLASKSMAVTLPLVLLMLDRFETGKITRRGLAEKAPFLLLAVLFSRLAVVSQGKAGYVAAFSFGKAAGGICIACGNLLFYLEKFLLPVGLSPFYPYPGSGLYSVPDAYYLAPAFAALAAWLVFKFARKVNGLIGFGFLFFAVTIAPGLQFIPIGRGIAADHFTYIPYLGLILIAAEIMLRLYDGAAAEKAKRALIIAGAALLLALSTGARGRCLVWRDSVTLWSSALEKYPRSAVALNNRGLAYHKAGLYDRAIADFTAALAIDPRAVMFHSNRAISYAATGELDSAQSGFSRAIELNPRNAGFHNNLGNVYFMKGDFAKAKAGYEAALRLSPENRTALEHLAQTDRLLGARAGGGKKSRE